MQPRIPRALTLARGGAGRLWACPTEMREGESPPPKPTPTPHPSPTRPEGGVMPGVGLPGPGGATAAGGWGQGFGTVPSPPGGNLGVIEAVKPSDPTQRPGPDTSIWPDSEAPIRPDSESHMA